MSEPPIFPANQDSINPFSAAHRSNLQYDTVFYSLYPDFSLSSSSSASAAATLQQLHSLHLEILNFLSPITTGYIWQHEPFSLSIVSSAGNNRGLPHLHGKLRYGDNVDDEWFVVSLLYRVSLRFPDLSVRVWDSDSDILLIEAAYHLPRWLSPDTAENRIFVRRNKLHIVPRNKFRACPSLQEALQFLIDSPDVSEASDDVQSVINRRISEFEDRGRWKVHRARVRVPVSVAQVLRQEPPLISLAVDGFYSRDIDTMKYAAKMEKFLPKGREEELVLVSVKMSRAMYAQMIQQKFQAPGCYPMPPMPPKTDQGTYMEAELGMKIVCGFEMMYQLRKKERDEGKGVTWESVKDGLDKSGYFEGLLPGSKEYKRLLEAAEEYYKKSAIHHRACEILSAPVKRIDEVLALPHTIDDFSGQQVPSSDDDSWLYGGEEELNSVLTMRQSEMDQYEEKKKRKQKGKDKANDGDSSNLNENDIDLGDIAKSMKAFMHNVSSFQGAEVPEERDLKDVDFDMDRFMKELEAVTSIPTHEDGDSDDFEDGSFSDVDFDESEDGSDMEEEPEEPSKEKPGVFMDAYSDVLNEELNSSTLKKSFVRANDLSSNDNQATSGGGEEEMDEDFTPVDVDVNLVKSLLDSFNFQQGLPGPASNLLGLMGKQLPHDSDGLHRDKGKGKGKAAEYQ